MRTHYVRAALEMGKPYDNELTMAAAVYEEDRGQGCRMETVLARAILRMGFTWKLALVAGVVDRLVAMGVIPGQEVAPWLPEIREAELQFAEAAQRLTAEWAKHLRQRNQGE